MNERDFSERPEGQLPYFFVLQQRISSISSTKQHKTAEYGLFIIVSLRGNLLFSHMMLNI